VTKDLQPLRRLPKSYSSFSNVKVRWYLGTRVANALTRAMNREKVNTIPSLHNYMIDMHDLVSFCEGIQKKYTNLGLGQILYKYPGLGKETIYAIKVILRTRNIKWRPNTPQRKTREPRGYTLRPVYDKTKVSPNDVVYPPEAKQLLQETYE